LIYISFTGLSPSLVFLSRNIQLYITICIRHNRYPNVASYNTHTATACPLRIILKISEDKMWDNSTLYRFRLFPFRSPLLRESHYRSSSHGPHRSVINEWKSVKIRFLFLWLLRCFTSPGLLLYDVNHRNNLILLKLGSPIRKSPGQRLLITSPKLIADCYVLLRSIVSRHSPYALSIFAHYENTKLFCVLVWFYLLTLFVNWFSKL